MSPPLKYIKRPDKIRNANKENTGEHERKITRNFQLHYSRVNEAFSLEGVIRCLDRVRQYTRINNPKLQNELVLNTIVREILIYCSFSSHRFMNYISFVVFKLPQWFKEL